MAINIKIAKWLKYDGNMHRVDGCWVKFIAAANKADVSFPWELFALGLVELKLELEFELLVREIKL